MGKLEFYKKQIELERKIISAAEESVKDVKNLFVRELILGISKDSEKHASMLSGLVAMTSDPTPLIDEKLADQLKINLEEHIALEMEAIDTYKELLGTIENDSEKVVIEAIYKDELRHHSLLKRIHKAVIEEETLREKDLWDMVWKDSLFHGSPGG